LTWRKIPEDFSLQDRCDSRTKKTLCQKTKHGKNNAKRGNFPRVLDIELTADDSQYPTGTYRTANNSQQLTHNTPRPRDSHSPSLKMETE